MVEENFVWMAGGPQGSGIDSAANIFARAVCFGGLHVYGKREYHSNIKGLHSYFHMRVSKHEVRADLDRVDLLCAFDTESIVRHIWELSSSGGIISDSNTATTRLSDITTLQPTFWTEFGRFLGRKEIKPNTVGDLLEEVGRKGVRFYPIPYVELLKEVGRRIGEEKLSRLMRMVNVLVLGASFGLSGYDKSLVEKAIREIFRDRPKIIGMNVTAFDLAYDYAKKQFGVPFKFSPIQTNEERILVQGTQAVALGKLLAGCRVQTYYPITPAADESEYLEENELLNTVPVNDESVLVMQTEDEIAAINMASGAALTGTRTATSTSGPGFSLMVEGLGWAGINEVPLVVTFYQRGGPSTGLSTRHGQGDLRYAIHASHGEFPRIVLCSGDIEECFYDAAQAFNYAERYQLPVIHLIDKALANSVESCRIFDLSSIRIERGQFWDESDAHEQEYRRFRFTESGISPRACLGNPRAIFWSTGDEHDEFGHICEEPANRTRMVEKRMRKLVVADREIPIQERFNLYGDKNADTTIVSWGSPKGAILEAMKKLRENGFETNYLQIRMTHPLATEYVSEVLEKSHKKIALEGNYSSQLAGLIRENTGIAMDYFILKWNGRPVAVQETYEALRLIVKDEAPKRQVLTYGS